MAALKAAGLRGTMQIANNGIHAFQMETAQSAYLKTESAPWELDAEKAAKLRPVLKQLLTMMTEYCAAKACASSVSPKSGSGFGAKTRANKQREHTE